MHFSKGCHDRDFWRLAFPEQLKIIGPALAPPTQTPA
jgi:hypothetical protein